MAITECFICSPCEQKKEVSVCGLLLIAKYTIFERLNDIELATRKHSVSILPLLSIRYICHQY